MKGERSIESGLALSPVLLFNVRLTSFLYFLMIPSFVIATHRSPGLSPVSGARALSTFVLAGATTRMSSPSRVVPELRPEFTLGAARSKPLFPSTIVRRPSDLIH
jgi:hypothetical protein